MKGSSSIRREMLASLLAREGIQLSQGIIPKRKTPGTAPLSFAQRRLWFLNQLAPNNPFYNCSGAVRLQGNLDLGALEWAINEIVKRHEVLRTRFEVDAGEPIQVIDSWEPRRLELVDLRNSIREEIEEEAQRIMSEEARAAFDLTRGPLLRIKLLKLGDEEHLAHITMHHIVSDGWSVGILFREIRTLYVAYSAGKESPLPELPIQYADFAAWQRGWLKEEALERQMEYWREQLKGLPVLELPTDYARPARQSFRGRRCSFTIDGELSQKLQELSRAEGVTLFMTLLAAFQTLLGRYSGQQDVAVGTMIANRNRMETEGLIGFFVNQLVLRADLNEEQSFRELLKKVRRMTLESYAHQDLPFELLVKELAPERSLARPPLCQVAFALEKASPGDVESQNPGREESQGLNIEIVGIGRDSAKYDLTVIMTETPGELTGVWEYCSDLYEEGTIRRMIGHFQTLLRSAVSKPDCRLCELELLTKAERNQILVAWNRTRRDYPRGKRLHELFEEQVERTPESVAVVYESQELSYRELNRRANRLASYLRSLGVGPEVVVGLCLDRSVEMVVGLLGVLKSGGGYLPLDPGHPPERLSYILEDGQASVLLGLSKNAEKLRVATAQLICLDDEEILRGHQDDENLQTGATAENLAYVIYTSGSTGQPKGVMVSHEGLCNMVGQQAYAFGVSGHDRVLQFAPLNFDASAFEIFMALSYGATLCLENRERLRTTSGLHEVLRSKTIDVVVLPPAVLAMLDEEGLSEVGAIISAGEVCSSQIVDRWAGGRRLFNAYGPTEGSVWTTLLECEAGRYHQPPIGRPIGNAQLYMLDRRLEATPVGVTGELFIGGTGLARGYLRRPGQTGEKFIPHPFPQEPGARLYRTGDLARYLADGNVEFIGRTDHQVKLRGYRIELGEIEAALCEHPKVKQCAVMLREDEPGQKDLVAYLVSEIQYNPPLGADQKIDRMVREARDPDAVEKPGRLRERVEMPERSGDMAEVAEDEHPGRTGLYNLYARRVGFDSAPSPSPSIPRREPVVAETKPTAEELREHLRRRIPEYMSPGAFVFLNELPLTSNGKVDREKLPPVKDAKRGVKQEEVGSRTPVEEILAGIYEEALRSDRVGIHDNFFEIGGHSLLATRVISRAKQAFGVNIAVSGIFEEPTIAGLGRKIEEMLRSGETAEAPPIVKAPRSGNPPLSFAQRRLWFLDQLAPNTSLYNCPGMVRLDGRVDFDIWERVINEIVRRHESLRTRFEVEEGEPVQVIDAWEPRRLEQVDLTSLPLREREEEAGRIAREEAETGFDLSRGPLLRVKVLKLGEEDHLALYTMHHIVSDEWLMGILIREVETLYRAYSMGGADHARNVSPLPELEIQYADFAVWQRAYLAGEVLEKEVEYWRARLKDAAVLELPTDRSRPPEPSYRGGVKLMWLGQRLSEDLKMLSQREGATLFMTLMAAFKALLMKYSGQEDISVGTAIANRTRRELEGLIGFFVNTLVMRTDLSGDPSFRELIRREKEVALGAYEHQEFPFEKLVEELNPERDLGRNPLFQVMMALQHAGGRHWNCREWH